MVPLGRVLSSGRLLLLPGVEQAGVVWEGPQWRMTDTGIIQYKENYTETVTQGVQYFGTVSQYCSVLRLPIHLLLLLHLFLLNLGAGARLLYLLLLGLHLLHLLLHLQVGPDNLLHLLPDSPDSPVSLAQVISSSSMSCFSLQVRALDSRPANSSKEREGKKGPVVLQVTPSAPSPQCLTIRTI